MRLTFLRDICLAGDSQKGGVASCIHKIPPAVVLPMWTGWCNGPTSSVRLCLLLASAHILGTFCLLLSCRALLPALDPAQEMPVVSA